jgi:NDP-sugar pyrophosphorylase family protein
MKKRISLTIDKELLFQVDKLVDGNEIQSRSEALDHLLRGHFQPVVAKAVLLAGGDGVRMRPFSYEIPKPLIPVNSKPVLEHMITALHDSGIKDIIICTGRLGEKVVKYFGDGSKFGVKITYSQEERSLGTGGALKLAQTFIGQKPFLLIHGDLLARVNFNELIKFHQQNKGLVTMALTSVDNPQDFGMVELQGFQVTGFVDRKLKRGREERVSHLVSSGIYVVDPNIFKMIPAGRKVMLEETVFPKLIEKEKLVGFPFKGLWFDLTTPREYEKAIKKWH